MTNDGLQQAAERALKRIISMYELNLSWSEFKYVRSVIMSEFAPKKPAEPVAEKSLAEIVGDFFAPGRYPSALDGWKEACQKAANAVEAEVLKLANVEGLRAEIDGLKEDLEDISRASSALRGHPDCVEAEKILELESELAASASRESTLTSQRDSLQMECFGWRKLVNDCETIVGFKSWATSPDSRCLVDACHELAALRSAAVPASEPSIRDRILRGEPFNGEAFAIEARMLQDSGHIFEADIGPNGEWQRCRPHCNRGHFLFCDTTTKYRMVLDRG